MLLILLILLTELIALDRLLVLLVLQLLLTLLFLLLDLEDEPFDRLLVLKKNQANELLAQDKFIQAMAWFP